MDDLKAGRAVARRYRNRRIGEFLKEIDLSEKKSTGITKILRTLKTNGSPPPEFETDDERNYFIVTVRPHESFNTNEVVNEVVNRQAQIIDAINENPHITIKQLAQKIGIAKTTVEREIQTMKIHGILMRVGSDKIGRWEIIKIMELK